MRSKQLKQLAKIEPAGLRFSPIQFSDEAGLLDPYSRLLTIHELAAVLKQSWRSIHGLKSRKLIPHIRIGRSIRFRLSDVERALEKMTVREVSL